MTQPPGRSPHHPGDGCTGETRTLSLDEGYAIRQAARRMVVTASLADDHPHDAWETIADEGSALARHYGVEGEWFLAALLAEYVRRNATPELRGPAGLPVLTLSVPECDPQAAALLATLARRHRHTSAPDERCGHLEAARLPLQTFMLHLHTGDQYAARRQWASVYQPDGETPPLTAMGLTVQLLLWASRVTLPTRKVSSSSPTATLT